VQYLSGGVESGFTHVERDSWPTRLLHVKGRRNVRVLEVPLALSSLNSGDVFILDAGLQLFQWNGREASRPEKAKGQQIAQSIKDDERGGRAELHVLSEGDASEAMSAFFALLGYTGPVDKAVIATAEAGGADDAAEVAAAPRLYKQTPTLASSAPTPLLASSEVTQRPLERKLLDSGSVCVLISGGAAYAWVGKHAHADDKKRALTTAGEAAALAALPANAGLKVVKEGTEPPLFTQAFHRWAAVVVPKPGDFLRSASGTIRTVSEVNVEDLVRSAKQAAKDEGNDEASQVVEQPGSGQLAIWRIENFERSPVPQDRYGQFFSGDSYVVLYTYQDASNRLAAFIYFWQGRDSSADERAAAALQAKALDDSMGGYPVQVRVVQGSEPAHFHKLFGGRMVVHQGGTASGFKNSAQASTDTSLGTSTALYHVRGTSSFNTHAVQVNAVAGSLNSGDCFVLLQPGQKHAVWFGKYSSTEERSCASDVAERLAPLYGLAHAAAATKANEGSEPDWFWTALGGKTEYAALDDGAPPPSQAPRLFQLCDAAAGGVGVRCEEVFNYSQDDLCDDDVMLLDVTSTVYLWIGTGATENEKSSAQQLAERYIAAASAADGRSADTPVVLVRAGAEPPMFTCHFIGWDATKRAAFVDPAAARQSSLAEEAAKELQRREAAAAAASAKAAAAVAALELKQHEKSGHASEPVAEEKPPAAASGAPAVTIAPGSRVIDIGLLKTMREDSGIDLTAKESYLSDAQFKDALGCSRADYAKLPKWKQADAKKKAGIF